MTDDMKEAFEGLNRAFEEFKATNDRALKEIKENGVVDPATKAKLDKIEADMAKTEDVNQKVTAAELQAKAAKEQAEELKNQLDEVKTALRRTSRPASEDERKAELKKTANAYFRGVLAAGGIGEMTPEGKKALEDAAAEYKSLSVGNDTTGGYLAPSEYVREITKGITEISAPRALVRVRTTGSKSILLPKRTGQFAAQRVSEQGTRSETTGLTWGMVEIMAPEMYALVDISQQNLEDSAFDLEGELSMEFVEQFAVKEGTEFVSGTGIGEMEGILTNTSVGTSNSGSAGTVADADGQANGLITLKHAIKTGYARNGTWIMNRTTLGSVRKLKDADKNYIWMPGIALGKPNTIDGDPYVEVPDMPNEGAGLKPVAYGDFRRAYTMVDRVAIQVQRDPFTQATSGNIRFIARKRVGGAVVLAEAIRTLTCAAL